MHSLSTVYEAVVALIGEVPNGMEPVVYVFCMVFSLFLLNSVVSILGAVFMGKGR